MTTKYQFSKIEKHKRDNDKSSLELGWLEITLNILAKEIASAVTDAVFFYIFCIFSLGVAVAVLDRKLYAAGGFDGRQAQEVREG